VFFAGAAAGSAQKPVDCEALREEFIRLEGRRLRIAQLEADQEQARSDSAEATARILESFRVINSLVGDGCGDYAKQPIEERFDRRLKDERAKREKKIREEYDQKIMRARRFPDTCDERHIAAISNECEQAIRVDKDFFDVQAAMQKDELRQRLKDLDRARSRDFLADDWEDSISEELEELRDKFDPGELEGVRLALEMSGCDKPSASGFADVPRAEVTTPAEQPQGFGDSPEISVRPTDGTARTILSDASSGDLLTRFNDACSVRNWELAEATLREASRGASWYQTGVQVLRNERERAAEGDQLMISKCYELESAMLAASQRNDWKGVQAFAAQARAAGCRFNAETCRQVQQLWQEACVREQQQEQEQEQELSSLLTTLFVVAAGAYIADEISDHRHRGGSSAAAPPPPAPTPPPAAPRPPPEPRSPSREPRRTRTVTRSVYLP
jgi:hypothetical protein